MPVQIEWFVENQIIHVDAIGDIIPEDVMELSEKVVASIDASDSPLVHVIISEAQMDSLPRSIKVMKEITKFFGHERLGWFLIYGNTDRDRLAIFVASAVTSMARLRHRRFATLEESLEFLASVDSSLPTVEQMLS